MAGIQPVDELLNEPAFYLQSLRQQPSESSKEYIDRAEFVWERLCDDLGSRARRSLKNMWSLCVGNFS
eukprot:4023314-Lingulodinium_polyedra.AAC.1